MSDILHIRNQIREEIFDYQHLVQCLSRYAKPRDKIRRLMNAGDIVRVKKGLYVFGEPFRHRPVHRMLLANLIYGPSYASLDYALAWHGLIPERVNTVTSVTTGTSRIFDTPFGHFSYRKLSEHRYSTGATLHKEGHDSCFIASPEKALADKIWEDKRFSEGSLSAYEEFLEKDLRIDQDRLRAMSNRALQDVKNAYSSRKIDGLVRYIEALQEPQHA